jgi:hypothetical protein
LGGSANAAGVASEGDGLLVALDVLQEGDGALELPAVDGLGGLAGVLEGDAEVGTAGAGRFRGLDLSGGVTNLQSHTWVSENCSHFPRYMRRRNSFLPPPAAPNAGERKTLGDR